MPVAILGSGPAGLMAATVVARAGLPVVIFEKKRGPGKKLLIAGSSGLNITHDAPAQSFHAHYRAGGDALRAALEAFPPEDWLAFVESLGVKTFLGSSRRYFIEGLKASTLLRAWLKKLGTMGVTVRYQREIVDFEAGARGVELKFADGSGQSAAAACFCLGGASYEPDETPLRWPGLFVRKGIAWTPFTPSNSGFDLNWPSGFVDEAEGLPLKNVELICGGERFKGDLTVTRYGLEGTPVYALNHSGNVLLDLKPDLSAADIVKKLGASRENLSPQRRVKKYLNLSPAALALLHHLAPDSVKKDSARLADYLKAVPLKLKERRPLNEAISSAGGLALDELDGRGMLRKAPGVFAAGEMLDWDAPTGGFLIQACVSQGYLAGKGILDYLEKGPR